MSLDQPTLDEFIRHAERYGSECVYETAAEGHLDAQELGTLSLALQRIDRKWRLPYRRRAALALALCDIGLPHARVCEMAQVSRATLHRLRQDAQTVSEPAKGAPDSAQPCGGNVSSEPSPTSDTRRREMRHRSRQRRSQRADRPRERR